MISSSLMVVNWNKELLSKCSFLCTYKAEKSCRLLYIKNASALSQTKAGAFSFLGSRRAFQNNPVGGTFCSMGDGQKIPPKLVASDPAAFCRSLHGWSTETVLHKRKGKI